MPLEPSPFVPGFEHDIFISYAHVDDLDGWVTAFQRELEHRLARRVGRVGRVRVWRDPSLDGSQAFDDVLKRRVESAAVFLALHSKGYLESEYCQQELHWFCEQAAKSRHGLRVGERRRALNVLLTNLDPRAWPQALSGTRGFPLHDGDQSAGDTIAEPTKPDARAFDAQIRALADACYRLLEDFRAGATAPETERAATGSVFVADTSDALQDLRERVCAELVRRGRDVVTPIPPPYSSAEHETRMLTALESASLSVHLLDGSAGRKIDDEPGTTYPRRQVELGTSSTTAQLLWVPPELDVEHVAESQRTFLKSFENRKDRDYDFVREPPDLLAELILEKLGRLEAPVPPPESGTTVLLDTHVKDQRFAFQLADSLAEKGVQPFFHQETEDTAAAMKGFEEQLARVEKLVVLFGTVAPEWVVERVNTAFQYAATRLGEASLHDFYVLMVPPRKQQPPRFVPIVGNSVSIVDHSSEWLEAAAAAAILGAAP